MHFDVSNIMNIFGEVYLMLAMMLAMYGRRVPFIAFDICTIPEAFHDFLSDIVHFEASKVGLSLDL